MKYRKRPVVVEAMQFTDENKDRVYNFVRCNTSPDFENGLPVLKIQTIHGEVAIARIGDYIVKEPEPGKYYPVKPDIFEASYEKVE